MKPYSKSYLIHREIFHKINESKLKFAYELKQIEVPVKVFELLGYSDLTNEEDSFYKNRKLNRFNRTNKTKETYYSLNFYNQLSYSDKDLDLYCKDDDILYLDSKRRLKFLKNQPTFVKGRWYHPFHEFSKKFRENVLTFEGEHLKEIFDVSASDLHMLAKHLEDEQIPQYELIKFQRAVKQDFRTLFGKKKNGKCTAYVKKAFKVWMNSKKERYDNFRFESLPWRIDEYMKVHFPTVRKYVESTDEIWKLTMNEEFDVMSVKMVNELHKMGVTAFTCHDAIYVKKSVQLPEVKKIFYQKLNLASDRIDEMLNL